MLDSTIVWSRHCPRHSVHNLVWALPTLHSTYYYHTHIVDSKRLNASPRITALLSNRPGVKARCLIPIPKPAIKTTPCRYLFFSVFGFTHLYHSHANDISFLSWLCWELPNKAISLQFAVFSIFEWVQDSKDKAHSWPWPTCPCCSDTSLYLQHQRLPLSTAYPSCTLLLLGSVCPYTDPTPLDTATSLFVLPVSAGSPQPLLISDSCSSISVLRFSC